MASRLRKILMRSSEENGWPCARNRGPEGASEPAAQYPAATRTSTGARTSPMRTARRCAIIARRKRPASPRSQERAAVEARRSIVDIQSSAQHGHAGRGGPAPPPASGRDNPSPRPTGRRGARNAVFAARRNGSRRGVSYPQSTPFVNRDRLRSSASWAGGSWAQYRAGYRDGPGPHATHRPSPIAAREPSFLRSTPRHVMD